MPDRPVLLAIWRSVGTQLARDRHPDRVLQAYWHYTGCVLAWEAGHGHHGDWAFDPDTQRLTCACGLPLHEDGAPAGTAAA